ncbi:MAG: VIT domain-containing protein [Bacillota bacterium]
MTGRFAGPLGSLRLVQVFGYTSEQCDAVLEAAYRFPLPGNAAVTGVEVRFGDVEIKAELRDGKEGESEYEEARREGKQSALVCQEAPDVFTVFVAGILPDQEVAVEIQYVQAAQPEGPGWSLRIPLTIAPRYVRSDEMGSGAAKGQPFYLLHDPGHRFSLDMEMVGADSVDSPTHALDVTNEGVFSRVRLLDDEVIPDRDFILNWMPKQSENRPTLQVWTYEDEPSNHSYFLALVTPPAVQDSGVRVPREVILLIDHSGSMEGAKRKAADWAVKKFLSGLKDFDSFNLGVFHHTTKWFSKEPVRADRLTVKNANEFLDRCHDSGGTELGVALEQALGIKRIEGDVARHVLIITDAQVTDTGRILRLADLEGSRRDSRRISILCIDAAPDSFLALELAERGGGVAKFLTSDPDEGDISTALDEILTDWSQPVFTSLSLEINRERVQSTGRRVTRNAGGDYSAIDLGDLPAERSIWIVGRTEDENAPLVFGLTAGGEPLATCRVDQHERDNGGSAIKALFGARRILTLSILADGRYEWDQVRNELIRLGYDPGKALCSGGSKAPRLYAENARQDMEEALRGLIVQESLRHGLLSRETSFVAIRLEAGRRAEALYVIGNAFPAGWSQGFLGPGAASVYCNCPAPSFYGLPDAPSGGEMMATPPSDDSESISVRNGSARVFTGSPQFVEGRSVLFDSGRDEDLAMLPERDLILSGMKISFPGGMREAVETYAGFDLLLFVDDPLLPRAKVSLADLIQQDGERPLNLTKRANQRLRILMLHRGGEDRETLPVLELVLEWEVR